MSEANYQKLKIYFFILHIYIYINSFLYYYYYYYVLYYFGGIWTLNDGNKCYT